LSRPDVLYLVTAIAVAPVFAVAAVSRIWRPKSSRRTWTHLALQGAFVLIGAVAISVVARSVWPGIVFGGIGCSAIYAGANRLRRAQHAAQNIRAEPVIYRDLDPSGEISGRWAIVHRLAWSVTIAVLGVLWGVAAVMGGEGYAAGPAALAIGLAVWRVVRKLNHRKQEKTGAWLSAYVDAIDKPRTDRASNNQLGDVR